MIMADQPNNVFSGEPTPPATNQPQAEVTPPSDNLEDLLKNIKNEQGEQKYKSLQDALVALDHSQRYIPELKTQLSGTVEELNRMKEQMGKFQNIEDTVQRLLAQQQIEKPVTTPSSSGLDEQAVLKLVSDSLQKNKQVETMEANMKSVHDALVSRFGDKVIETLENKAKELNTTRQALGELAKSNPKLVLALFEDHKTRESNPTVPNRQAVPPFTSQPREQHKSLLSGVSMKDQAAVMNKLRDQVFAKHGIDK